MWLDRIIVGGILSVALAAGGEEATSHAVSLDAFAGDYRAKSGEEVYVRRGGDRLFLLNGAKTVALEPRGSLAYAAGEMQIDFQKGEGGGIERIACRKDQTVFKARRVPRPFRMEECSFLNGDVRLNGTLLIPEGPGPHPALIFVWGSGPSTRDPCLPSSLPVAFARAGIAVLSPDKRGRGASNGGHWADPLEDLAEDALAALKALQEHPDIDPKRIGLWGASQGGWIVPIAAATCPDVAFAILVSAPGVRPEEQDAQRVRAEMRAKGVEPGKVEAGVVEYLALRDQCVAAGRAGDEAQLRQLLQEGKQAWWGPYALPEIPGLGPDYFVEAFRAGSKGSGTLGTRSPEWDPRATLEKVACPVLAVYGEKDCQVPVDPNRALLEESLRKRNRDVTVRVFPCADHILCLTKTGTLEELSSARSRTPAPGYFECLVDWVRARMKPAPEQSFQVP